MADNWIGWGLLGASALLALFKELLSKPRERRKRRSWRLGWMSLAAAAMASFLLIPKTSITSEDIEQAIESGSRKAVTAILDSLKQCNSDVADDSDAPETDCSELATRWAAFAETAFDSAQVAMGLRDYNNALIHLQYALLSARGQREKLAEAFFYSGNCLLNLGRLHEATESYDSALVYEPNDISALNNRGIALDRAGDLVAAIQSYRMAVTIAPKYVKPWYNMGSTLVKLSRWQEAEVAFGRATVLKPDFPEAWCDRCAALCKLGRLEEGLRNCDSALAYNPDLAWAWNNRGAALVDLGRCPEGLASCDKAIFYQHDLSKAWFTRAHALRGLGRYLEELQSCDSAILYKHDDADTWYYRAGTLTLLRRYDDALRSCDSALRYRPDMVEASDFKKAIVKTQRIPPSQ